MGTQHQTAVPSASPSLLVRAAWFVFVGWWASGLWLAVAWVCNVSVVGLPIGLKMIEQVPYVVSLKPATTVTIYDSDGGTVTTSQNQRGQYSLILRALYFALIGWWLSLLWMGVAYLCLLCVVTLPVSVYMFSKLPAITTLKRY